MALIGFHVILIGSRMILWCSIWLSISIVTYMIWDPGANLILNTGFNMTTNLDLNMTTNVGLDWPWYDYEYGIDLLLDSCAPKRMSPYLVAANKGFSNLSSIIPKFQKSMNMLMHPFVPRLMRSYLHIFISCFSQYRLSNIIPKNAKIYEYAHASTCS